MKLSPLVERRIIYSVLMIAVALPLIFPIGWTTEISGYSRMAFQLIESTAEDKVVIISFDYDPSTMTELQPMAEAMIVHAFKKKHKVIATALWPMGVQMAEQAFSSVLIDYPDKVRGEDYVNLGYKVGGMVTIQAMGRSLPEVYPKDTQNMDYDAIPMLKNVHRLKDIAWISSLSSGVPGIKEWMMVARDNYQVPVTGGCTAISAPGFFPYVNEQRQLYGLLGGLKAASEYESLIGRAGSATTKMDAQSIAHLLILVFIALGNIKAYKAKRRKELMIMFMNILGIWLAAFFTLCIFSFLYQDNPFYKFSEQVFVGLSAAYWLVYIIYSIMVPNLFAKLVADFSGNIILLIPATLGVMMLMRLHPKTQWLSRYPIAIMIGTTAGISMLRYMKSDILEQVTATMINPFAAPDIAGVIGNLLLITGTITGVFFFYFSKKQEGFYKVPSKIGIWFLMVSFGATFGYTVMARISLLIGRLEFLLRDWLHIIR